MYKSGTNADFIIQETYCELQLDENLDWIRLEKYMDEEWVIPQNAIRKILEKFQTMKISVFQNLRLKY